MKRFKVQAENGHTLLLYYRTQAEAQEHWPDATIGEYNDQSHVEYIHRILDAAMICKTGERNGSIVHVLQLDTLVGTCIVQLMQDSVDGAWLDFCKYQLWKTGAVVVPVLWDLSNPADFCKRFLFSEAEYTVLSSGRNHQKPKELRGIRKFASVSFGKCKCQLFQNGDDLYIDHHDYFSQSWRPPADDIGKPTTYYLKKYFGISKPEKFCYADCWGDIVLQNKAWLRITNFVPIMKILNAPQIAKKIWPMIREYHSWSPYEHNTDWERFLEAVTGAAKEYLNEQVSKSVSPSEKEVGGVLCKEISSV